ncbi:hypothetical protein LINGRAHAP2_LOCUS35870 [Linum grandiflorum]
MVASFMRSLSFPNKKPPPPPPISHHLRSISLPSRPHPLISHLRLQITDLRLSSSGSISDGLLTQLKDVHDYLDDILRLPQTQDSLRRHPAWIDDLLDDFLRFADAFGTFQNLAAKMKEELFAAKMAVRKRDDSKTASFLKFRKKFGKEMEKLVQAVRTSRRRFVQYDAVSLEAAELARVLGEVMEVTVEVSEAVFKRFSVTKTTSKWIRGLRKRSAEKEEEEEVVFGLKRKSDEEIRDAVKRLQRLEGCICEIENGGEKVFRSLISTRVSLLNCLTVR